MTSKKVYFVMVGLVSLSMVLLIGGVVAGDMLLKKRSANLMALKLENRTLEEQQNALARANKDVQKYAELEQTAKAIVPQDKDQAKTVREIVKIADESNVAIASITFPSSTLGQKTPVAAPGTGGAAASPGAATPGITQVKPVIGLSGVYQMEITVTSDSTRPIPYSSLIAFLSKLEQNRRTAQVSTINIIPTTKNPNLITFSLGINVFIKP